MLLGFRVCRPSGMKIWVEAIGFVLRAGAKGKACTLNLLQDPPCTLKFGHLVPNNGSNRG